MEIVNSKKFYEQILKGKVVFSNFLSLRAFSFIEKDLIPEYIICDAEHYQYLQDECKSIMGAELGSQVFKVSTLSLVGEPVKIIVRFDFKGIDLFAKHKD